MRTSSPNRSSRPPHAQRAPRRTPRPRSRRIADFRGRRLANFPQVLDVFAIDAHGMSVFDVQANRYLERGGSTWQRIAGGNLVSISVGVDGTQ